MSEEIWCCVRVNNNGGFEVVSESVGTKLTAKRFLTTSKSSKLCPITRGMAIISIVEANLIAESRVDCPREQDFEKAIKELGLRLG